MTSITDTSIAVLQNVATQLRIDSILATTEAGSGHPTSCMSAAEIMATLFFGEMRYDPRNPKNADNDRFVLSKGHAAPVLYAAWAEAGLFPREHLLDLRKMSSDLEGHPTPRLSFADVATGSLGQGICAGIGIALNARRIRSEYRTYVLLGDGEMAEGSVWEAASVGPYQKLDNLCAIIDVNGLGQSQATQLAHATQTIAARWQSFTGFLIDSGSNRKFGYSIIHGGLIGYHLLEMANNLQLLIARISQVLFRIRNACMGLVNGRFKRCKF